MRAHAGSALVVALLLTGCVATSSDLPLRVFAASSLTEAFTEAGQEFERSHGVPVEVSFAGSQTLVTQLESGVEGDVLATADPVSMQTAVTKGLVLQPVEFASNTVVVITPAANPGDITVADDLAAPGVRLVIASDDVPVGRYARALLARLGLTDALRNVVSEEQDTKGVLGKVASAEADAGIVYATDVTNDVRVPSQIQGGVLVRYPVAVTSASQQTQLAQRFVDYLIAGEGSAVLSRYGFGPPQVDGDDVPSGAPVGLSGEDS